MFDLADHIGDLKRVASTNGGEYAGACPWCGGTDRFRVWPSDGDTGGFWCRQCGESGDGIDYLRKAEDMTFPEACEVAGCEEKLENGRSLTGGVSNRPTSAEHPPHPAESWTGSLTASQPACPTLPKKAPAPSKSKPPAEEWQSRGSRFADVCSGLLWEDHPAAASARAYLRERGFPDETICEAGIGLNPRPQYDDPEAWGLDRDGSMWIPRGIVIPWTFRGRLWGVNIRRPNGDVDPNAEAAWKHRKYQRIAGSKNALYNADRIDGRPVALVEGEFDALAIESATDEVAAVATGSTHWGRSPRWRALLRTAPLVLVAYDCEEAGEEAARYWTETLPGAVRWRPHLHDTAEMLRRGADLARWIHEGLDYAVSRSA